MKPRSSNSKFFLLVTIAASAGVLFFVIGKCFNRSTMASACAFCDQSIIDRQKFYEDDLVLGLVTHKPIVPGHVLIVSKRHVERFEELTQEEIARIGEIVKKVNAACSRTFAYSSYLLLQKNGVQVGQTVPHMHMHYIPRKQKESPSIGFLLRFFFVPMLPALSEAKIHDEVAKMKIILIKETT